MADKAVTTSVATSSTSIGLPVKTGFGSGPNWAVINILNMGLYTVWVTQASGTAVAEADENIAIPSGTSIDLPSAATAGIALTAACKVNVVGLLGVPGSVY